MSSGTKNVVTGTTGTTGDGFGIDGNNNGGGSLLPLCVSSSGDDDTACQLRRGHASPAEGRPSRLTLPSACSVVGIDSPGSGYGFQTSGYGLHNHTRQHDHTTTRPHDTTRPSSLGSENNPPPPPNACRPRPKLSDRWLPTSNSRVLCAESHGIPYPISRVQWRTLQVRADRTWASKISNSKFQIPTPNSVRPKRALVPSPQHVYT